MVVGECKCLDQFELSSLFVVVVMVVFCDEGDFCVFNGCVEVSLFESCYVDENVFVIVFWCDEVEVMVMIEEFNGVGFMYGEFFLYLIVWLVCC